MCIASVRNMTGAIKIRDALSYGGIKAEIVSIDASITKRGCSYGVSFPCEYEGQVRRILGAKRIDYGEILGARGNRLYE